MAGEETPARLFVAVDVSARAREEVAAGQRRIQARYGDALRFVRSEQLHLTLAFMAAVDRPRVPPIAAAIERGFECRPFAVTFAGLGVLPARARPRVLYLAVASGADDIVALQRLVQSRLAEEGITSEDRPFRPHLTLARWREGAKADARAVLSADTQLEFEQAVDGVTLYESRLSPRGATHIPIARGRLAHAGIER